MSKPVDPLIVLFGELIGLRIVVQRLLGRAGADTAMSVEGLGAEHEASLRDLGTYRIVCDDPVLEASVRACAERGIDDMFTVARGRLATPPVVATPPRKLRRRRNA